MTVYTDDVRITWIFTTLVPLDEAHYEKDQDEESDCTHQSNKPPLGGNVYLPAGYSWTHTERGREGRMETGSKHNSPVLNPSW